MNRWLIRWLSPLALLSAVLAVSSSSGARPRSEADLPERYRRSPFALMSLSVGAPNNGWQLRAKKLRRRPELWVQKKSRPYIYGHPALVLMLERTAKQIGRESPGSVLLIGDLSREDGGPLAGHRSHQSGRDADVGFFVLDKQGRPQNSRKAGRVRSQWSSARWQRAAVR